MRQIYVADEIRDIPGFLGYGASSDGRVWSRWKWGVSVETGNWREVTQRKKTASEYRLVKIGPRGRQVTCQVHRLVAAAFFGPIPPDMVVDHLDCDKSNNTPGNLEIVTREENERRSQLNGLKPKGESHGNAIYSESTVRAIRTEYAIGETTPRQLSQKYGVRLPSVWAICSGRMWKHV
jgi:hypothetical protein